MSEEAPKTPTRASSPEEYVFPEPNPQEAMFFFNIIKNVTNLPDINWDNVASDSGFKNAAVAKKRFYQIKQKLGLDSSVSACGGRKSKASSSSTDNVEMSPDNRKALQSPKVTKRRTPNVKKERDARSRAKAAASPTKQNIKMEDMGL